MLKLETFLKRSKCETPNRKFTGKSYIESKLKASPELAQSYIAAPPRMAFYIDYSTRIYNIYLRYITPEDIHVYSIDEVFMDVTNYLATYEMTARELTMKIIHDVLSETGITATAGIGTNMYLCKIAMDVMAKRVTPDKNGVRIAELNEIEYRRQLWGHRPLTDFWRIGRGYAKKLEDNGLYTMGDIAKCSLGKPNERYNEDLMYKLFGINAELLIDHAWGWEPVTIADVKSYKPETKSLSSGQVLQHPYTFEKAKIIVREMIDLLVLDIVEKGLVTDQVVLTIGYDIENLANPNIRKEYQGEVKTDFYGRKVPKHAHGTANIGRKTSSIKLITDATVKLYEEITDKTLLIRRITKAVNRLTDETSVRDEDKFEQLDLFTDYDKIQKEREAEKNFFEKGKSRQKAMINIKKRFGKNAVIKGTNLEEGATGIERNRQIGGHKE